ncbi:MAG TPA: hypothetical protein VJV79_06035, partial [Polyangiaceae bacterium]|nr:hypothetical protein [Polyangiaceae bacterium]
MDVIGRGSEELILGEHGLEARRAMQLGLLRSVLWLLSAAAAVLTLRESVAGSPVLAAALATITSLGAVIWTYRRGAPVRVLGLVFFCALVVLITKAAIDLGGARGSALSFAFIPGLLAVLVLGP